MDTEGTIRTDKVIREEKRGKRNVVTINTSIHGGLVTYLAAYEDIEKNPAHYLFFSTKQADYDYTRPISRGRAWQVISEVCKAVGLPGNYGTHTIRKTWGYHARKSGVPMEIIR